MAERRMFSKAVVETDLFYDMPPSAQALYFHLGMNADDDGFLSNARSIQSTMGSKPDDIKLLFMKGFLIPVEDGLIVIRHWLLNNRLRSDRYHETTHTEAKKLLLIEGGKPYEIRENCVGIPNGNQTGAERDTQYSIGKDSLGKNNMSAAKAALERAFNDFWMKYPRKESKKKAMAAWLKLHPSADLQQIIFKDIEKKKQSAQWLSENGKYIPQPATYLTNRRWEDEGTLLSNNPAKYVPHLISEKDLC